ncbi:kinase-like domain-containing protein [Cadophora sp. MPI-SDFR-AT-0126]|nr:kinase-like domain-containing protein [Leotiomycetes sp. MPI-SDFR-AT-0126]
MVWQKASDSLDSDVSSPGSDVSVNDQYEHDHSPSLTIKPAEALPHEKGSKGKYSLADFEVLRPLSTGSFARVHLVRSKNNSRFYTLKVRKKEQFVNKKRAEYMRDEIRVLSRIRHPFLIRFWGTFQDSKNRYIINEFLEGGDMLSLLREAQRFPNDVAKFYAAEVILAIEYLHAKNIIYRAIKPQNILLDRHGHLKLCNFGIAREVEDITWTICGTAGYLAPEVVSRQGYNLSADWWAVGILVYEMLCGYDPFSEDDSPLRTYENIRTGIVNYPPILHPDAHDLLQQLITADLTKRLGNTPRGAKDIKCHAWFAEVPWERLAKKDIDPPYVPPVMGGVGDASQYYERPKQTENCSDYGNVGNVG